MTQDSVQTPMLRQELKAQQDVLATAAHPRAIEMEIERLEQRVALSEQHDAHLASLTADRETDRQARESQAAEDLEAIG